MEIEDILNMVNEEEEKKKLCEVCDEQVATYQVALTTVMGVLLDYKAICKDCARHISATEPGVLNF